MIAFFAIFTVLFRFPSNGKAYPKSFIKKYRPNFQPSEFPFPSNGKAYPKELRINAEGTRPRFQFPSNGKAYPKDSALMSPTQVLTLFPFPSNGKAYPKASFLRSFYPEQSVSIPFKRESVSKARNPDTVRFIVWEGFHSLQTGKRIQRISLKSSRSITTTPGFHSLQTGKRIQSSMIGRPVMLLSLLFPFPSNGKAYPKTIAKSNPHADKPEVFPFPSNGKAYPKTIILMLVE